MGQKCMRKEYMSAHQGMLTMHFRYIVGRREEALETAAKSHDPEQDGQIIAYGFVVLSTSFDINL